MTNKDLISKAESVLHPHKSGDRLFGNVGAAVMGTDDKIYLGVCVDSASWGLCAERSAIAAMVTNRQYKIKKVVAVWRDERDGKLYVLPPCGHCRQFMRDVDESNLESEVILGKSKTCKLKELLPEYEWPQPLED